ncbi:restriction endonuclease [Elysia marginata]|uniref:Restriction endonuclease n=1 Tax=Elysia marginata TaxID=1093978 RepID=A0AAV4F0U5_9GAST|nr:restriction endonuclease [Elysia marginata]
MAIQSKAQLKAYFETGTRPTEEQFATLIDSLLHISELQNLNLTKASQDEAEAGKADDRYTTPLKVAQAIKALTRLAEIPELETEVQQKIDQAVATIMGSTDADSKINTLREIYAFLDTVNEQPGGLKALLDTKAPITHQVPQGGIIMWSGRIAPDGWALCDGQNGTPDLRRIVEILDKFDALTNSISEGLPREIELRRKQYEYYRDALLKLENLIRKKSYKNKL